MSFVNSEADFESHFKNANNGYRIKEMFFETNPTAEKKWVSYSLKAHDHLGYPSIHRLYLEMEDPTEFLFATTYFDCWEHWELVTKSPLFRDKVAQWRKELELKLRSKALASIIKKTPDSLQAARYVANWEHGDKAAKGRPSKAEIAKQAKELASNKTRESEDFLRLVGKSE